MFDRTSCTHCVLGRELGSHIQRSIQSRKDPVGSQTMPPSAHRCRGARQRAARWEAGGQREEDTVFEKKPMAVTDSAGQRTRQGNPGTDHDGPPVWSYPTGLTPGAP